MTITITTAADVLRFLAEARAEYDNGQDDDYLSGQINAAQSLAEIVDGTNDGSGWLPSWRLDEFSALMQSYRPDAEPAPEPTEGLYAKFRVKRLDPAAQARHAGCRHFVLDLDHDPHALPAIAAYARSCEADYPALAIDLRGFLPHGDPVEPARTNPTKQAATGAADLGAVPGPARDRSPADLAGGSEVSYADTLARTSLMRTALDGLVPLYMLRMARRGLPSDVRIQECVDIITANGDDLEHSREDGAGAALNAIAEAIATLALLRPEGVNILGGHWCRDHTTCAGVAS